MNFRERDQLAPVAHVRWSKRELLPNAREWFKILFFLAAVGGLAFLSACGSTDAVTADEALTQAAVVHRLAADVERDYPAATVDGASVVLLPSSDFRLKHWRAFLAASEQAWLAVAKRAGSDVGAASRPNR